MKVLSKVFRGKFLAGLEVARDAGRLDFAGSTADLAKTKPWKRLKSLLYHKDWVVYAKPPFGGLEHVVRYLGRYTHRVAISNHRLVDVADGRVTFTWKDYAAGCAIKHQTLDAVEFLRRFLLHVLPRGFVRIAITGSAPAATSPRSSPSRADCSNRIPLPRNRPRRVRRLKTHSRGGSGSSSRPALTS